MAALTQFSLFRKVPTQAHAAWLPAGAEAESEPFERRAIGQVEWAIVMQAGLDPIRAGITVMEGGGGRPVAPAWRERMSVVTGKVVARTGRPPPSVSIPWRETTGRTRRHPRGYRKVGNLSGF